jgi:nucleoside phosphorylase
MTIAGEDLKFVEQTIDDLKDRKTHKVLFHVDQETQALELTLDSSAFISNRSDTKETDEHYTGLFVDLVYRAIRHNYQKTISDQLLSFIEFLKNRTHPARKYHYPLLEIYVRDPKIGGPLASPPESHRTLMPYGYITEPGMYETSVTCPTLFEGYLRRQIRHLIENHVPVLRVRTGLRILPIHFAIEAHALGEIEKIQGLQDLIDTIDVGVSNEIRLHFEVPKLGTIDDVADGRKTETVTVPSLEFINQNFFMPGRPYEDVCKAAMATGGAGEDSQLIRAILQRQVRLKIELLKRDYEIKPLSLFNGDRVDYSLGRIRHYTKTFPSDFQNFVIFTNYQMYVEEFAKYCVAQVLVRFAHLDETIDLARIVESLGGRVNVSAEKLDRLGQDDVKIVVPAYPKVRDGGNGSHPRPFSAKHIVAQRLFRIDDGAHGKCRLRDGKIHISSSDMDGCIRTSLLKVFGGKESVEHASTDDGKKEERLLSGLATELFEYFLQDRKETGIMGAKTPQMPAYHLTRNDQSGITMVNIGVGPSNAKTITDHISVLRPYVFLMLGHCAGLRATQQLGHYVLANGYLRADGVLDDHSRVDLPIPPINEIHAELVAAFDIITGSSYSTTDASERTMSPLIRTGTVATTSDRNWELRYPDPTFPLERAKAIGADMESATIAANGFRYSVPYATFLCISDRPLHGDLKLEGMADTFYRDAVAKHFRIAIGAMEALSNKYHRDGLPTRKLRDRLQPPFQ